MLVVGIFGTGRNGSSLLARLLDGSPNLWVYPIEVNYLSVFSDLSQFGYVRTLTAANAAIDKPLCLEEELDVDVLVNVFSRHFQELQETYIENLIEPIQVLGGGDALQKMMKERNRYLARDFLLEFLENVKSVYDTRSPQSPQYHVFKSVEVPYIEEYVETYPEMQFIHIVRHPLTNYSSLKRTNMVHKGWPFWHHGGDELRMFLEKRWIPHVRFIVDACLQGTDKHFVVKYEDLCDRPDETIHTICRWLRIAPPADPTLQTVLGGKQMIELPSNPSKKGVKTPSRVVDDMAKEFGYEDVLTSREKEFILVRTYQLAHHLGYVPKKTESNFPSRLELAWKWLLPDGWELMNARSPRLLRALVERRCYIYSKLLFPSV